MSSTLYRVAFRTAVSDNVLSQSSGFLRLIVFHSCITVETLLLWKPIDLRTTEDGDSSFSETSVRNIAARYKVSEDIFN
jgi:hypothetical protein